MVGVWEGLNLGSIPNDHMPSQKDPKISIERRCSTILPMDGIGLDGMVVIGNRYSKSTTGANNNKNSLTIVKA